MVPPQCKHFIVSVVIPSMRSNSYQYSEINRLLLSPPPTANDTKRSVATPCGAQHSNARVRATIYANYSAKASGMERAILQNASLCLTFAHAVVRASWPRLLGAGNAQSQPVLRHETKDSNMTCGPFTFIA